jgi:integrase
MTYKPTLTIIHKASKKDASISHLYLVFTQNRIPQRFSLNKIMNTSDWKPTVKGFTKDRKLNHFLKSILEEGERIIKHYEEINTPISFRMFREEFKKKSPSHSVKNKDLYPIWEQMDDRDFNLGIIQETTYKQRKSHLNTWKSFRPYLAFYDINDRLIDAFVSYRMEQNIKKTTISMDLQKMSSVINSAIKKGLLQKNPFPDYISEYNRGVKHSQNKKESLTIDEREQLRLWYNEHKNSLKTEKQRERLRLLIVMSYTGMAYADIQKVTFGDIKTIEHDGKEWKVFYDERQKNNKLFKVVIHPSVVDIVYESYIKGKTKDSDKIFMKLDLSYFNRSINNLLEPIGINRKVTTHVGRHTFGMISLEEGMQKDTLQRMFGHTDSKQTDIYAQRSIKSVVADAAKVWKSQLQKHELYDKADLEQERQIINTIIQFRKKKGMSVKDFYDTYAPVGNEISRIEESINNKNAQTPLLSILEVAAIARNLGISLVDLISET